MLFSYDLLVYDIDLLLSSVWNCMTIVWWCVWGVVWVSFLFVTFLSDVTRVHKPCVLGSSLVRICDCNVWIYCWWRYEPLSEMYNDVYLCRMRCVSYFCVIVCACAYDVFVYELCVLWCMYVTSEDAMCEYIYECIAKSYYKCIKMYICIVWAVHCFVRDCARMCVQCSRVRTVRIVVCLCYICEWNMWIYVWMYCEMVLQVYKSVYMCRMRCVYRVRMIASARYIVRISMWYLWHSCM